MKSLQGIDFLIVAKIITDGLKEYVPTGVYINNERSKMSNRPIALIVLILCSSFLSSCMTTSRLRRQDRLQTYVGSSENYIISAFGEPSQYIQDGGGKRIMLYDGTKGYDLRAKFRREAPKFTKVQFYLDENNVCQRVSVDRYEASLIVDIGIGLMALGGILALLFII